MMVTTASPAQRRMETFALWALLAAGALIMIFPIYWMFATAIRPKDQIFSASTGILPTGWVWRNFADALNHMPFLYWFSNRRNRGRGCGDHGQINLLCGDAFAKFRFAGRDVLFLTVLSALMIPVQVIIVPLFFVVSDLGLLNLTGRDPAACRRSFWHLHGAAVYGSIRTSCSKPRASMRQ